MFSKLFCKHEYTLSRFENRSIHGTRSSGIVGIETHRCNKCGHEMEKQVRAKFPRQYPPVPPRVGGKPMLSRSDELRFYEAEKRILRQFEDDKDVQDYLEYLEIQDEELFIRVSDLKIEIQELEEELSELAEACNEWVSVARELDFEIMELKILNNQLKQELKVETEELKEVDEDLRVMTEDLNIQVRLNSHILNKNNDLKADLERLRRED